MKKFSKLLSVILLSCLILEPTSTLALTKKETVYTNLDSNGKPYKTLVNNHLYINEKGNIKDETELKNILNINGDEKFSFDNGILTWDANNKDIFYQGETDKESLISIDVKYYLNGKEMNTKDMLNKKGDIKIELNLINNSFIIKNNKKLYTPVVVTVGTIINNKENSNIEITNGKTVDTGTKNMLVAIASPGLYESTNINELKDLDKITISYKTNKFKFNDIYLVATPKLLEEVDFDIFSKVDKLSSSMALIQKNMDKIENGSKELKQGTSTLKNGTNEITKNLNTTLSAVSKLQVGSEKLDSSLKQIISALNSSKEMINNKDIEGSLANLNNLKNKNKEAITTLTNANNSISEIYNSKGLASFKTNEEVNLYFKNLGVDDETIQSLITIKKTYEGNNNLITLLTANNTAIDSTISSLTEISKQIEVLLNNLNNTLIQVESGASTLNSGLKELKIGVNKLYNGSVNLNNGASSLNDGVNSLSNGITILNKDGINKLTGYTNKVKLYSDNLKEINKLSKDYDGFASKNASNTIFIYKMNSKK